MLNGLLLYPDVPTNRFDATKLPVNTDPICSTLVANVGNVSAKLAVIPFATNL